MAWKFLTMIWPREDDLVARARSVQHAVQETSVLYLTPDRAGVMIESMNKYLDDTLTPVQMIAFHASHGQRIQIVGVIETISLKERK